jgi:hypothetical protein
MALMEGKLRADGDAMMSDKEIDDVLTIQFKSKRERVEAVRISFV